MRLLAASLTLWGSVALACACPALDFSAGVAASPVVFEGVVDGEPFESNFTDYVYAIRVTRVFKGDVADQVYVTTPAACGEFPASGSRWVFVIPPDRLGQFSYEIHRCGIASKEVAVLTPSERVFLGSGHPPHVRHTRLFAAALLLSIILAAAVWRFRQRT